VGTDGQGVYRFLTGHEEYELIGGVTMRNLYVKNIVVSPDDLVYILTTSGLIVVNGDAWYTIETLPDLAVSLSIDPSDPNTLYAGTVSTGVWRSSDAGRTWKSINTNLGLKPGVILRVSAIAIDEAEPSHLALATAYGVGKRLAGGSIYESIDAGKNWMELGTTKEVANHLVIKNGGVYAATANGLARYGEPLSPPSFTTWLRLHSLAKPTTVQVLILILTVARAGWVLVGRLTRIS